MIDKLLTFRPQKCKNFRDVIAQKTYKGLVGSYMITEKLDGWWAIYNPYTKSLHSSTGRVIPALTNLASEITEYMEYTLNPPTYLIGEVFIQDKPFHETNGLLNRKNEVVKNASFTMHDALQTGSEQLLAMQRYEYLVPEEINSRISKATILSIADKEEQVFDLAANIWGKGGEGVVLKLVDGKYGFGQRNTDLMKLKLEVDFDLLCINYFTTIGEKGNTAYNMTLLDSAGTTVNVRIGLHKDIENFALTSPIGKVVKIETMGRTNQGSYREPRFLYIRHDKTKNEID